MSGASNYLEDKLLNHVCRKSEYQVPSANYMALYTADPTDTGCNHEVGGGSYARRPIVFGNASGGQISNSEDVVFPTATTDWGVITHVGILDAETEGHLLFSGAITTQREILDGEQLVFNIGDIQVTMD